MSGSLDAWQAHSLPLHIRIDSFQSEVRRRSPVEQDEASTGAKKAKTVSYSCSECKRTKAKCSRVWPCSECVRKKLAHLCPDHVASTAAPKAKTIALLTDRVKELEEKLRRLGQDVRVTTGEQKTPSVNYEADFQTSSADQQSTMLAKPHDMSAMLGRLALGTAASASTKRYAGTEAAPFYLSSPDSSEDEDREAPPPARRKSREVNDISLLVPWSCSGSKRLGNMGDIPGSLLDRCRDMLPSKRVAKELWAAFWEITSWRIQAVTSSFFLNRIMPDIYDSQAGPHPHHFALMFALTSAVLVLDPSSAVASKLQYSSREYLDTAWACLVAGKMFTHTTLESLVALSFIGACLLNADDKKSPDGNFAVFGLAVRLAVIAGYHRDPSLLHQEMPLEEMDARRRIWYELLSSDRLHSMPALLPNSVDLGHYDTKMPSDADPKGLFVWKWTIGVQISRVVDYWTSARIPPYTVLQEIDAGIRRLLYALPTNLRCPDLPANAFRLERPGAPIVPAPPSRIDDDFFPSQAIHDHRSLPDDVIIRQRIRLAMHFCMLFFYLHRPCFIRSVVVSDSSMDLSVQTMVETCEHIVTLTGAAMIVDQCLSRWFSFAADLFSVLHCLTLLIIKCPEKSLESHMILLERGVSILQHTVSLRPTSKNRALLRGAMRLLQNAQASWLVLTNRESVNSGDVEHAPISFSPLWQEWLNASGQAMAGMSNVDMPMDEAGMGITAAPFDFHPTLNSQSDPASIDHFLAGLWQTPVGPSDTVEGATFPTQGVPGWSV